jgi:ABC-2 type transport system ATP-binding protein
VIASDRPAVVVKDLCKRYGHRNVVDHLNLAIEPGEVFGFLGPNGAGKTTTIDILTGRRPRTSGAVQVLDEDPWRDSPMWRSRIGVVPQSTGEYPVLTVQEVVSLFAALYPRPLPVDDVIDMVGLTQQSKTLAQKLSGGQRRRLDVAVGVVGDPELLFLDEPTTGLDPVARREAWDLVRFFSERGTTTVLTTHYLDEVESLAQRAAIITAGSLAELGTVRELSSGQHAGTTISCSVPDALRDEQLPRWDTEPLSVDDERITSGKLRIETIDPCQVTYQLLDWARAHGTRELLDFRVVQPSLEEVYLRLVHEADRRAENADPARVAGQ